MGIEVRMQMCREVVDEKSPEIVKGVSGKRVVGRDYASIDDFVRMRMVRMMSWSRNVGGD